MLLIRLYTQRIFFSHILEFHYISYESTVSTRKKKNDILRLPFFFSSSLHRQKIRSAQNSMDFFLWTFTDRWKDDLILRRAFWFVLPRFHQCEHHFYVTIAKHEYTIYMRFSYLRFYGVLPLNYILFTFREKKKMTDMKLQFYSSFYRRKASWRGREWTIFMIF